MVLLIQSAKNSTAKNSSKTTVFVNRSLLLFLGELSGKTHFFLGFLVCTLSTCAEFCSCPRREREEITQIMFSHLCVHNDTIGAEGSVVIGSHSEHSENQLISRKRQRANIPINASTSMFAVLPDD